MDITPSFLKGREVLFVAPEEYGPFFNTEYVLDGSVVGVNEERNIAFICFLYGGHKSTTTHIEFARILGVFDKDSDSVCVIANYRGPGHDLRGKLPFGTHPIPA